MEIFDTGLASVVWRIVGLILTIGGMVWIIGNAIDSKRKLKLAGGRGFWAFVKAYGDEIAEGVVLITIVSIVFFQSEMSSIINGLAPILKRVWKVIGDFFNTTFNDLF